jgi:DNA-binding transcriptional regulator YiaG
MGPARTYIPNLRLQWHRHRLRLTQEQVAEQIVVIAWERFAVRVGVDARMVSKWERGEKRPSRLYQECLRLLFNDPELFGAGDDAMNRRQWLRGTAAVGTAMLLAEASPGDNGGRSEDGTMGQLLADATAESVELSRQTEASDLGPATLEHLDLAVERLGVVYMTTPPGSLLDELCWYRRRAVEVLGGRHTLAQQRRLYVAAGWLTGLLGHLSFDLGDYQAARAHCVTAWQLADDAGERELGAWVRNIQAMVALYTRRFMEAVRYAEAGGELAAAGTTGSVQLPVLAARAHARLGNRHETGLASDKQSRPSTDSRSPVRQRASFRWMRPGCRSAPVQPTSGWTRSVPLSIRARRSASMTPPPGRVDGPPTERLPASISPRRLRSLANRRRRVRQLWIHWPSSPNGRSTRSCDALAS